MNNLKQSIELLKHYNIEQEKRNIQQLEFSKAHDELLDDYDNLHDDFTSIESTLALNKLNGKALSKELDAANAKILELTKANNELQENAGYKRKYEVAIADLARCKKQVERIKSKAPTKIRKDKKAVSYDRLNAAYQVSQKHVNDLLEFGKKSPQFTGGLDHSKQGVMDFVDLKPEPMGIRDGDGEEVDMLVQRVVVINKHNSCKMITRIIGQDGIHTVKIPTGGIVQIDDEGKDHIAAYFEEYDKHYNGVKK